MWCTTRGNLSPLLFALFLNDLESFLKEKNVHDLSFHDDQICNCIKLMVLIYADDTVLLADSAEELQKAINDLMLFCNKWKLQVNKSKTMVVIFGKRKTPLNKFKFYIEQEELEQCYNFKYLGVEFKFNGMFNDCKNYLVSKAEKVMYFILKRSRDIGLPIDIQLELFNKMVVPILLYGCEVWGHENIDVIEKLTLKFQKMILGLKPSTNTCLIQGELGAFPIMLDVKLRIVAFWLRIVAGSKEKLCYQIYKILYQLTSQNSYNSPWLLYVKGILNECGLSYVWDTQFSEIMQVVNSKALIKNIKRILQDQYIQTWRSAVHESSKCILYRSYKCNFNLEEYLLSLPVAYRKSVCKFRTSNHKLAIEKGRYSNVPRNQRFCNMCNANVIGDEFHFVFECKNLDILRQKLIPKFYTDRPNILKFEKLMSFSQSHKNNLLFAKFIHEGLRLST